jgi:hypothetical protein
MHGVTGHIGQSPYREDFFKIFQEAIGEVTFRLRQHFVQIGCEIRFGIECRTKNGKRTDSMT